MIRTGNEKTGNRLLVLPAAAGETLTECTMAAINETGYAEAATKKEGLKVAGCVQSYCDNAQGADGGRDVNVKRGAFVWENDGTIKATDILKKCYIHDDVTVTITETGSSVAGTILAVEEDGVTVDMTLV